MTSRHVKTPNPASDFAWKIDSNGVVSIVKLVNRDALEIVVPSEIAGRPVGAVEFRAFSEPAAVKSLTLPDSLQRIAEEAFFNCFMEN